MAVSVGPTVIVVPELAIESVARRLVQRSDSPATVIVAPANARALARAVQKAQSKRVIVHGVEHFDAAGWERLDLIRTRLERDPPIVFLLSPSAAERLSRHAQHLASWVGAIFRRLEGGPSPTPLVDAAAQAEFDRLSAEWLRDTQLMSSLTQRVRHPAYQQIIAMGERAIPPILRDLSKQQRLWGPALHAITGALPVPAEDAGRVKAVAEAWLGWARENGYRW